MPEKETLRLDIDKLRLDEEWVSHAGQFYIWARKQADAQLEFDNAKNELELIDAELDKAIRDKPEKFGIGKLSNEVVTQTINLQKDHQLALKVVNESRHRLNLMDAAVQALEHRKRALTLLVELFTKEYYADPNPRAMSEGGDEFDKQAVRSRARRRMAEQDQRDDESDE